MGSAGEAGLGHGVDESRQAVPRARVGARVAIHAEATRGERFGAWCRWCLM
jgi:hypothetical protein